MLKRHEVEILLKAGHAKTEVARLTGVALCTVKRIAQENPVMHVDDRAERVQRQIAHEWPVFLITYEVAVHTSVSVAPAVCQLNHMSLAQSSWRWSNRHFSEQDVVNNLPDAANLRGLDCKLPELR